MFPSDKLFNKGIVSLRHNEGMLRDCWWEMSNEPTPGRIFVIRQISMIKPEQEPKLKIIRLTEAEALQLAEAIKKSS